MGALIDMSYRDTFVNHFDSLMLPVEAKNWLLDLWDVIQGLDDWYDEDFVSPLDKEIVIYKALVMLPSNPFYLQFANHLAPILSNSILKWSAANKKEQDKEADEKSFMWRASYYDVVLEVVRIIHGPWKALEISNHIANMYGESYEEYLKEFENA